MFDPFSTLPELTAQSVPPTVAQAPRMPPPLFAVVVLAMLSSPKLTTPTPGVMTFMRRMEEPLDCVTLLKPPVRVVEATVWT